MPMPTYRAAMILRPFLVGSTSCASYLFGCTSLPSQIGGSVSGRGSSSNPFSSIGFERRHDQALQHGSEDAFVQALLVDVPPAPPRQAEIVAANRSGRLDLPR
jgi:hypothetical protein